jgi:hypothetical protein
MPPEGISLSFPKIRGKVFVIKQLCFFFCTINFLQKILVKEIQVIIKKERLNCTESFKFVLLASQAGLL